MQECGLTMLVRLWDGYSTGLFLDQRANRQWVRKAARGRQVLNLFAYTRSFAVAALAGEARSCTCVDISRKYLDWGDRNLALNSLPNAGQTARRFVIPVVDFLRAARTRRESYGLIILDPPSFSRDKKGRTHRIAEDLPALCAACWELLEPGGHLLVSTNHQPLVDLPEAFERRVMAGLRPAPLSRGSHTPDADLPDIGTASMRYAVLTRP